MFIPIASRISDSSISDDRARCVGQRGARQEILPFSSKNCHFSCLRTNRSPRDMPSPSSILRNPSRSPNPSIHPSSDSSRNFHFSTVFKFYSQTGRFRFQIESAYYQLETAVLAGQSSIDRKNASLEWRIRAGRGIFSAHSQKELKFLWCIRTHGCTRRRKQGLACHQSYFQRLIGYDVKTIHNARQNGRKFHERWLWIGAKLLFASEIVLKYRWNAAKSTTEIFEFAPRFAKRLWRNANGK